VNSAQDLKLTGEKMLKEGDEEEAYLNFMRFVFVAVEATRLEEASTSDCRPIFNSVRLYMDKADVLSRALARRYSASFSKKKEVNDGALTKAPPELHKFPSDGFAGFVG
jgi:hypothetical protein